MIYFKAFCKWVKNWLDFNVIWHGASNSIFTIIKKLALYKIANELFKVNIPYESAWNTEDKEDNLALTIKNIIFYATKNKISKTKRNQFLNTVNKDGKLFKDISISWDKTNGTSVNVKVL